MDDSSVQLIKGSGTVLKYAGKNPTTAYYTPQDRDRNALARNPDGTWVETQPDGFQLFYSLAPSSGSASGSASGSGVTSGSASGSGVGSGTGGGSGQQSGSSSGSGSLSSGTGGVSTNCCPNPIPSQLYLSYSSITGTCAANWASVIPNPIPLNYLSSGDAWVSPCYYDATDNCSTMFTLLCNSNGEWTLNTIATPVTLTVTCSPFQATVSSMPLGGANGSGCATVPPGCCKGGTVNSITITQ